MEEKEVLTDEIKSAIELLNKNGYIVSKINKAQMAIAELCRHDKNRCNFNLLGIKCVDLLCVQEMIREQLFPYFPPEEEKEEKTEENK